jgi:tetratricopeptide (TPR) repeat protein
MNRIVLAVMLLAACRGGKSTPRKDADPLGSASAVSGVTDAPRASAVVPALPRSEDGAAAVRAMSRRIDERASKSRDTTDAQLLLELVTLRLQRAAILGKLDDYTNAMAESARLVQLAPDHAGARTLRFTALMRVHDFDAARRAVEDLAKVLSPSLRLEHEVALADAIGDANGALAGRREIASVFPSPQNLTLLAVTLAREARYEEALALVPTAAAAVRDNPPVLLAWLLFQWGRIYELKGELATAREFYAAANTRLPGSVEATAHLAATMNATGNRSEAKQLVGRALADNRHPELLALATELGDVALLDEARAAWERYVAALPLAFADHAARFYLGVGRDPKRAFELARINQQNRDTREARTLMIEAALAIDDAPSACALVEPIVRRGTRAQQFLAWQALSTCGRTADAERLARTLGIAE